MTRSIRLDLRRQQPLEMAGKTITNPHVFKVYAELLKEGPNRRTISIAYYQGCWAKTRTRIDGVFVSDWGDIRVLRSVVTRAQGELRKLADEQAARNIKTLGEFESPYHLLDRITEDTYPSFDVRMVRRKIAAASELSGLVRADEGIKEIQQALSRLAKISRNAAAALSTNWDRTVFEEEKENLLYRMGHAAVVSGLSKSLNLDDEGRAILKVIIDIGANYVTGVGSPYITALSGPISLESLKLDTMTVSTPYAAKISLESIANAYRYLKDVRGKIEVSKLRLEKKLGFLSSVTSKRLKDVHKVSDYFKDLVDSVSLSIRQGPTAALASIRDIGKKIID